MKTKVLVTSVAKSLDDDNEEAHRLLADSAEVTPVEDKAAEEKAYDDAEVFTGDSNESVESANAANGATAESLLQAVRSVRIACPRNTPNTSTSAPTKRRPRAVSPCGRRTSDSI